MMYLVVMYIGVSIACYKALFRTIDFNEYMVYVISAACWPVIAIIYLLVKYKERK